MIVIKDYQRRAQKNYINKFDVIQVRAPKGDKEKYMINAERLGLSLNDFVVFSLRKECRIDILWNPLVSNQSQDRAEQ